MNRCAFFTGASGFLGSYLLEALLRRRPGETFLVLARPAAGKKLESRFGAMGSDRLQIIPGDITQAGLGLAPQDLIHVRKQATEVWHLAASTSFDEAHAAQIEEANLRGSVRVLDLARQIRSLDNLYHVSTAYITGRNHPTPTEDGLPADPQFNNTYERTKWEGEKHLLVPDVEEASPEIKSIVINVNGTISVTWEGGGELQSAASLQGPWVELSSNSPFAITPQFGGVRFFRVVKP